jgi:flagellar transcriptional activator FlhD
MSLNLSHQKTERDMNTEQMINEVRELNLSYLMLAQQMIRDDKDTATFRLGINKDMADIIDQLTPAQIAKMSSFSTLLCRFRFDDRLLLDMLTSHSKDRLMSTSHAMVLMAGKPVEAFA